jgi:hypothetical protein
MMTESTYGYFPGGDYDPRRFEPDEEACTPAELAAWKEACAAWDRGERPEVKRPMDCTVYARDGRTFKVPCNSPLGLGIYEIEMDDDPEAER